MNIMRILAFGLLVFYTAIFCLRTDSQAQESRQEITVTDEQLEGSLPAPDFPYGLEWLNCHRPFSLTDFRGKLVLLHFWRFSSVSCLQVLPDIGRLEKKYPDELVVIGVHSARFSNERDGAAIRQAILRHGIQHPVLNDSGLQMWNVYGVHSWPTLVLINPNGKIIGSHSGEDVYDLFDPIVSRAIRYFDGNGELQRRSLLTVLDASRQLLTLLSFPGKVAADVTGRRLLIADSRRNRVIITDTRGTVKEVIGSGKPGNKDGSFADAEFSYPQGVCLDGDNLYIADTDNHTIRAANLATREVKTILGNGKRAVEPVTGGTGTTVALSSPCDLLVHDGKLYIAMAGTAQLSVADLKTLQVEPYINLGGATSTDSSMEDAARAQPSGITTDAKKLYFVDSETSSIRSAAFSSNGVVESIIGNDSLGFGDVDGDWMIARLQHPMGIACRNSLLYVADTYNSKIKVIDPFRRTSTTLAGNGKRGYIDGEAILAQFNEPTGLAFIGDTLYVADANNHQIRTIDMKTKMVGTMQFREMQLLAAETMGAVAARLASFPEQRLAPGKASISLVINAPQGYKLNESAPCYFNWKSNNEKVIRFTARPAELNSKPTSTVEIPLETTAGFAEVIIQAVVYFCKEGSNVCLFDNVRAVVPIVVGARGPNMFGLNIKAKASPPK